MEITRDDFLHNFHRFEEHLQKSGRVDRAYKGAIYFLNKDYYGMPNHGMQTHLFWTKEATRQTQDFVLASINETLGSEYLRFADQGDKNG